MGSRNSGSCFSGSSSGDNSVVVVVVVVVSSMTIITSLSFPVYHCFCVYYIF